MQREGTQEGRKHPGHTIWNPEQTATFQEQEEQRGIEVKAEIGASEHKGMPIEKNKYE